MSAYLDNNGFLRAITMVGLPGANYNKKAEANNLAKPGVLRNAGGKLKSLKVIFWLLKF